MRKSITLCLAAVTVAAALAAPVTEANARGGAVAAGIIGGLAVGAIVGAGIANSGPAYSYPVAPAYPAYAPAEGYVVYQSYRAPGPVACPGGYWARRPVAFNAYGEPIGWSRPRFICPPY
jgi:hypothetical protein